MVITSPFANAPTGVADHEPGTLPTSTQTASPNISCDGTGETLGTRQELPVTSHPAVLQGDNVTAQRTHSVMDRINDWVVARVAPHESRSQRRRRRHRRRREQAAAAKAAAGSGGAHSSAASPRRHSSAAAERRHVDAPNSHGHQQPGRRRFGSGQHREAGKHQVHSLFMSIRRHYAGLGDVASYVALGCALYGALYLALGSVMLPPASQGWALFLLWACAHVGGYLAVQINLPPLLGMLLTGVLLRNLPSDLIRGLPSSWGSKIRIGGLAVILMRAGLKIDREAFKRAGGLIARLSLVPMLADAIATSVVYKIGFSMPYALALTGGFIASAISPTVLVTGMLELQRKGYKAQNGLDVPSVEMASAGMDSISAIVGFSIAAGVAIPSGNLVYSVLSGPLSIVYGLVGGLLGSFVCTWALWSSKYKRSAAVLVTGVGMMYLGQRFRYLGASSVACLSLTILCSLFWSKGSFAWVSRGRRPEYAKVTERHFALLWLILVQPLLFGAIGGEIDFHVIPGSLYPKAFIAVAIGTFCVRCPCAFLVLARSGFTLRERLFIALSWVPKATIQGALGSTPLDLIKANKAGAADYEQYLVWGEDILQATVLSIIVCAPIGLLVIGLLGPRWLVKGQRPARQKSAQLVEPDCTSSSSGSTSGYESDSEWSSSVSSRPGPASTVALPAYASTAAGNSTAAPLAGNSSTQALSVTHLSLRQSSRVLDDAERGDTGQLQGSLAAT